MGNLVTLVGRTKVWWTMVSRLPCVRVYGSYGCREPFVYVSCGFIFG